MKLVFPKCQFLLVQDEYDDGDDYGGGEDDGGGGGDGKEENKRKTISQDKTNNY